MHTYISACCDVSSGWLAVVDYAYNRLDIYDASFTHHTHVQLQHLPKPWHGVASVSGRIIEVNNDDGGLVVYDRVGREVGRLSRKGLKLGKDYYIERIARVAGDWLLIVAKHYGGVTALHLYTVK